MKLFFIVAVLFLVVSCDAQKEADFSKAQELYISGDIAPDTVYRGMFVSSSTGLCGLVLIDAGQFSEDFDISFNPDSSPPYFSAGNVVHAKCTAKNILFMDLLTGQSHLADAPRKLEAADSFVRNHLELLLL
jgi:hypothetical protein